MHAAIVAGGFGTRAEMMTAGRIPKALLPIDGIPIIFRQMRMLRQQGVNRVSVLAGHLAEQLGPALTPEASALGLALQIIVEPMPLGTAGCLAALEPGMEDTLIVYGDMLFDMALRPLRDYHNNHRAILTVVAHPNDHPRTSDLIVEDDGIVKEILPRGQPREHDYRNLVPAGVYLASAPFFAKIRSDTKSDMIGDLLPKLIAAGERIAVYNTPEYLRDIGTPARHALAEQDLASGRVEALNKAHRRPAIFFDCDGVLNEEPGGQGVLTADAVRAIPGAGSAVRRAREAGRLAVAITNRPQVAKGLVTFEELQHILGRLEALLASEGGVLDRIYVCPHHPEAGFPGEVLALKIRCDCRKPGTSLLRRAGTELPIEPRRSAMIGDSLRDIGAARNFGIWAYGVRTGAGCRDSRRYHEETGVPPKPDLMFANVSDAVDFELSYDELCSPIVSAIRDAGKAAPVLVGICGRSRSGKSAVAHAVVRTLKERNVACLHVRLDDWIMPASERGANCPSEIRNRVDMMPDLIGALRSGKGAVAPGYDPKSRGAHEPVGYDASGQEVIVVDGIFACHRTIRSMLDIAVFVAIPPALQRSRFIEFYRWKGLAEDAIESLWRERVEEEWPAVDAQRDHASVVMALGEDNS